MNSNLEKWITALRDGSYPQGQRSLAQNGDSDAPTRFCCLGVACDLYAKEHPECEWAKVMEPTIAHLRNRFRFVYGDKQSVSFLPDEVGRWLGLEISSESEHWRLINDLMYMNDVGRSFLAIADRIEKHLT